jgi:ribosome-binding factor A
MSPPAGKSDRKAHQLCRQVAQTLDEVLAECGDRVLQCLRVEGVQPFPDASRLLVTVAFIDNRPGTIADIALVLDHLHRASGHLRCEIATAVTRKRAPLLLYRLAEPPGA